jgi:ADP-dependent NAD(P)H-hydrate dehydratase / NAD(P)H-hydrate epimerase
MSSGLELLTTAEMAEADRLAVAAGVPFLTLMENAGRAVADEAEKMVKPGARMAVLCGPGNNGGDGFVAARLLRERGYEVQVACLVELDELKGDAAVMAALWTGTTTSWGGEDIYGVDLYKVDLIIDALFGAGLSRPLDGDVTDEKTRISDDTPVLSIDVPSGLDGTTGMENGSIFSATRTVTFFRKKPGHVLMPGRAWCGEVVVADIGIPEKVLFKIASSCSQNAPELWQGWLPRVRLDSHKYTRGHAVVVSGPPHATGAARLGARGALRMGAGLVTVASPLPSVAANAVHLTAIMIAPFSAPDGLAEVLADKRKNAVLIGPGCGVGTDTRRMVEIALASDAAVVLDADALTSFAPEKDEVQSLKGVGFLGATKPNHVAEPSALFALIGAKPGPIVEMSTGKTWEKPRQVVLTPHEGEFKRLFPDIAAVGWAEPAKPNIAGIGADVGHQPEGASAQPTFQRKPSKLDRARAAAARSGAVVILKGPDTVIAAPDGRAAINDNAPPWLATAGSGDVLAGFVTGLLAQGMPAFEAACAAVWLHGECANQFGPGLIAEDIPEQLPKVLRALGLHENWPGMKV